VVQPHFMRMGVSTGRLGRGAFRSSDAVWRALAFGGCFCPYRGGSRAATLTRIVQEIELDEECAIGDAGTPSLAEMLAMDGTLRVLAVQGNSVGVSGAAASRSLTHACSLRWVRELTPWPREWCMAHLQQWFGGNDLDGAGAAAHAGALTTPNMLQWLIMDSHRLISDAGAIA